MFQNLTNRLSRIVNKIRNQTRLTEENTSEMLREIRLAFLEADVAVPVIKQFISCIKEKALGKEVTESLSPGEALISIVQKELCNILSTGNEKEKLNLSVQPPAVILMVGIQGSGKTTTTGKLGKWIKQNSQKKKILCVSCDIYRPSAIAQLQTISEKASIDFFLNSYTDTKIIAQNALNWAKNHYYDVLLVDTAGRLSIDNKMLEEMTNLYNLLNPIETLFVTDAMLGQDALNIINTFHKTILLSGIILTKMDADARGGSALSIKYATNLPIKFIGTGEKLDSLEYFDPDRMSKRILGMGDILALVDAAQKNISTEEVKRISEKIKIGQFDLNDFKKQIQQMQEMGGLHELISKLPSQIIQSAKKIDIENEERKIKLMRVIIDSMTYKERANPEIIKSSRKKRIAMGAGVKIQEINYMLSHFNQMKITMNQFKKNTKISRMFGNLFKK